jgi:predicted Zn-dependent peptidase
VPTPSAIQTTILPNGLTVITEIMPHVRSVTTTVYTRKGSRHDAEEQNGLAHFVEHMVFKGSSSRTARQMSLDIGELGGVFNAFTSTDAVVFYATVLDNRTSGALEVLSDMILNPQFSSEEIAKERGVIEQEINEHRNNPSSQAFDLYMRTQWPNSSLGLPIGGSVATISSFSHDDLSSYAACNFTGHNMVIAAAGNLQHDDYVREVERHFGKVPAGIPPTLTPAAISAGGAGVLQTPIDQVHLVIGFPAPPQADPRYYTVHMVSSLLGYGPCSRFFHTIREEAGLVYTIDAEYSPSESDGYFRVYAVTSRDHIADVQRLILQEFDRLKTGGPSETELLRIKDQLVYDYFIGSETSNARAHTLAGQFMALGRSLSQDERQAEIECITAEQLRDVASDLFNPSKMVTIVVGAVQTEGQPASTQPVQSNPQPD